MIWAMGSLSLQDPSSPVVLFFFHTRWSGAIIDKELCRIDQAYLWLRYRSSIALRQNGTDGSAIEADRPPDRWRWFASPSYMGYTLTRIRSDRMRDILSTACPVSDVAQYHFFKGDSSSC
jgi:hypothetical protein